MPRSAVAQTRPMAIVIDPARARVSRRLPWPAILLLAPALLLVAGLLGVPLLTLLHQSVLPYIGGRVGAEAGAALTAENYTDLLKPAYYGVLWDTLRLSFLSAGFAVLFGALLAFRIARTQLRWLRKLMLAVLILFLFLSMLVRIYAIVLTFGPTGPGNLLLRGVGLLPNSRVYAETMVVLGFLHYLIPVAALVLVGTFQNIGRSGVEAALSLGAPRWQAHLTATVPPAAPGLVSAFFVVFSLAVSSFVIPLILGRGKVQFLANLSYARFSEVANYPSGAAIAMVLLAICLCIVGLVGLLTRGRAEAG